MLCLLPSVARPSGGTGGRWPRMNCADGGGGGGGGGHLESSSSYCRNGYRCSDFKAYCIETCIRFHYKWFTEKPLTTNGWRLKAEIEVGLI